MHGPTLTSATPPSPGPRRRLRRLAGLVGQEVTSPGVRAEVIGGLLLAGILALAALLLALIVALGTYLWEAVSPSADNPERDVAPVTTVASIAGVAPSRTALRQSRRHGRGTEAAAERACPILTVADTVVNGRDDGLYVKACFAELACDRLALAGVGQRVHAQCPRRRRPGGRGRHPLGPGPVGLRARRRRSGRQTRSPRPPDRATLRATATAGWPPADSVRTG